MNETFDILHPHLKKLAKARFKIPTEIQKKAIPKIMKGENVLVVAGTGSGKTLAVALPIFSKLASEPHKPISLLYLTPMKALNNNLLDRLVWWSHKLDLEIGIRHGDTTPAQRKVQVEYPPHILISTPEQIQAMLSGKRLRELLKNIKYIIIDEVHELADSKRGVQLSVGIERLKQLCGSPQIIALSATIGSPKKVAHFFNCKEIIDVASEKRFNVKVKSPIPTKEDETIAEKIFIGNSVAARIRVMNNLIKSHRSTLLFTNTRESAEVLSSRMKKFNPQLKQAIHHSSLSKGVREKTEKDFKSEDLKSIICTSSLQLGIDIGSIDLVLQYQSPREVTQLIQRFGRSGHSIYKTSKGIIISGEGDDLFESAVIARRVLENQLEPLYFHKKSLDVLTHQIIGIANDQYKINLSDMFKIIKCAYPYKSLTWQEFLKVLNLMQKIRMIWINNSKGEDVSTKEVLRYCASEASKSNINFSQEAKKYTISRGKKALTYYFENLSTIPDSKSFLIIDTTSQKSIGRLDENFIAEHSDRGSTFIVKGVPWRVVSVEGDKVFVEPSSSIESAVPVWKGELIPVPFEVAQEVGKIREEIRKGNIEKIKKNYPIDAITAKKMENVIKSQKGKPFASDKTIVLEKYADYTIVNACFGSRVNETLANFISALIAAEHGIVVMCKSDPYRIIFQKTNFNDIKQVLSNASPKDLEVVLENSLTRSAIFKSRFLKVAKRFGIIRRSAVFEKIDPRRLIRVYHNTPAYEETLKEIYTEKLDLEKTKEVMSAIQSHRIKIIESSLSPIGEYGLRYELHDVARPNRPEKEILRVFKQRLLNTKQRLVCVNCGDWDQTYFVKDIPKTPRCPKCSSRLISVVHPHATESKTIIKKWIDGKSLSAEERKKLYTIKTTSDVLITYAKKGSTVLSGRGVGPMTAKRILRKYHKDESQLLKHILAAERDWLATKQYWH